MPDARFRTLVKTIAMDEKFAEFAAGFYARSEYGSFKYKGVTKTIPRKELPPLPKEIGRGY